MPVGDTKYVQARDVASSNIKIQEMIVLQTSMHN